MRLRLALAPMLVACALGPGPLPAADRADGPTCVLLFQDFDLVQQRMSTPSGRGDRMPIPPRLQLPAMRLRTAGCLTMTRDLAPMDRLPPSTIADAGPPVSPSFLHAGVVTNTADDDAALAFFAAHGVAARSLGAAGLGRRVYIGPFATRGALDGARDLAVRAGFRAPYPVARF